MHLIQFHAALSANGGGLGLHVFHKGLVSVEEGSQLLQPAVTVQLLPLRGGGAQG